MIKKKLLTIVTPNLNGGKYLEETIKSVLSQKNKFIEYIIVDGLSNDNSKFILKKYEKKIDKLIFKKDSSMYEAINTGFKNSSGKYFTWLNSDDLYHKDCLDKIIKIMEKRKIDWVNGISSSIFKNKIRSMNFPYYFPRGIILRGYCHKSAYGFIPQESVIFSRKLYIKSGGFLKHKKISGDYFLWKSFSKFASLIPINVKIGIFRKRKGQLSENLEKYYLEMGVNYKKKRINILRLLISFFYLLTKSKL